VKLTDTHCHLFFEDYQEDLDQVIERARQAGVGRVLVPAIDLDSSREVLRLIDRYDLLYGAVGIHPNSGSTWNDQALSVLIELASHPKVVAIGEIGLDYYRDRTPRDLQKRILKDQLDLARESDLPVVLHVRNRTETDRSCIEDLLDILEDWLASPALYQGKVPVEPGVIHSYSGNLQESQRALQAGFVLGITGPVTYKNASSLREVVRQTDLKRLLIETDGPFLSPQAKRGKRNEPAHVRYIVDKISEVTGQEAARVADQTAANAERLFTWECDFD
jgi:TatD DNase family protein